MSKTVQGNYIHADVRERVLFQKLLASTRRILCGINQSDEEARNAAKRHAKSTRYTPNGTKV